MGLTHFPHGVTSFGMPIIGSGPVMTTGNVFFVDSGATNASDGNVGSKESPCATLDGAVNLCTAANGDVIFVMPGHAESLAADSAVDIDVAGVSVIGLGKGDNRPVFTFATATTADFKMAADDLYIANLVFKSNITNLAMMIEVSGDDCEITNCLFAEGTASMLTAITIGVADGDADHCWVHHNEFRMDEPGASNVGDAAIAIVVDNDNIRIEDNWIFGDFDLAGIDVTTAGNACDNLWIARNYVENTATGQHAIEITTAGTMNGGAIVDNRLVADTLTAILEPHTLQCVGNRASVGTTNAGDFAIPAGPTAAVEWQCAITTVSTAMTSGFDTTDSPVTIFTVTGDVLVMGAWATATTAVTTDSNAGTWALGVTSNTAALQAQTTVSASDFAQHNVWSNGGFSPGQDLETTGTPFAISGEGTNIILTIATQNTAGGTCVFYCLWAPISAGSSVVGSTI